MNPEQPDPFRLLIRLSIFPGVAALAAFVAVDFGQPVSDPDTLWHLKTGEYILKNGSIPRTGRGKRP